jgi:dATP pyrophosphohydrolase
MTKIVHAIVAIMYDKDKDYHLLDKSPTLKTQPRFHFLILKKKGMWEGWQFVQGTKEEDEDWEDTARREVKEETGLDCEKIIKIDIKDDYWFKWENELIHKFLTYFLVKVDRNAEIKLSEEHSDYKWVDFETAYKELKFDKAREQFKKAFELLKEVKK